MNDRVTVRLEDGVADVRLNRADKMNALDEAMFAAIIDTGERLAQDNSIRAVVLSGEGRAFCAGLDIGNFTDMAGDKPPSDRLFGTSRSSSGANRAQQMGMIWRDLPMPVIAALHGVAFGGGLQIAMGSDIRFATPLGSNPGYERNGSDAKPHQGRCDPRADLDRSADPRRRSCSPRLGNGAFGQSP